MHASGPERSYWVLLCPFPYQLLSAARRLYTWSQFFGWRADPSHKLFPLRIALTIPDWRNPSAGRHLGCLEPTLSPPLVLGAVSGDVPRCRTGGTGKSRDVPHPSVRVWVGRSHTRRLWDGLGGRNHQFRAETDNRWLQNGGHPMEGFLAAVSGRRTGRARSTGVPDRHSHPMDTRQPVWPTRVSSQSAHLWFLHHRQQRWRLAGRLRPELLRIG